VNGLGLAIGPIVGGLFAGMINWRYAFFMNIPFIIVSVILSLYSVPEKKELKTNKIDMIGCVMLVIALMSLVSFFSLKLHLWIQCGLLGLASITAALFIWHELNTQSPIVEFHFFKNKHFLSGLLSTFFLAFFYCIVLLTLPMFLSMVLKKSDIEIGLYLLPATVTFSIASSWVGNKSGQYKPATTIIMGLLLFAIAAACLSIASHSTNAAWFIPPLLLFGMGWGAILGPSTLIALNSLPREQAAVAMGTSWTVHNVGGACGIALAVYLLGRFAGFAQGYQSLMFLLAGLALCVMVFCRLLNR
jgi:MFS family permease